MQWDYNDYHGGNSIIAHRAIWYTEYIIISFYNYIWLHIWNYVCISDVCNNWKTGAVYCGLSGTYYFCQILCIVVWGLVYCSKRSKSNTEEITLGWKQYLTLYAVSVSALLIISSVQYFSRLKGYDNVQMYSVYVVMACGTLVVVTLMQIVVLSQNASMKKANDMYKDYIRLQKQHYEHMLLQYDELRKFRHDVKNHMIVLNSMCTSEDSTPYERIFESDNT